MDRLLNLNTDIDLPSASGPPGSQGLRTNKVHLRLIQQGKRRITTIEELDDDLDQQRIAKALKRVLNTSTAVVEDDKVGEIIKIQGDHRLAVRKWFIEQEIFTEKEAKARLVTHGA